MPCFYFISRNGGPGQHFLRILYFLYLYFFCCTEVYYFPDHSQGQLYQTRCLRFSRWIIVCCKHNIIVGDCRSWLGWRFSFDGSGNCTEISDKCLAIFQKSLSAFPVCIIFCLSTCQNSFTFFPKVTTFYIALVFSDWSSNFASFTHFSPERNAAQIDCSTILLT